MISSTDSRPVPWLLGVPGAPLIPDHWVRDGTWVCSVITSDDQGRESSTLVTSTTLASSWQGGRRSRNVNWAATSVSICKAVSTHDGAWWRSPIEESLPHVPRELTLRDLPLLETTHQAIERAWHSSNPPIRLALELSRREAVERLAHPLALLDLEYALTRWLPHRESTWLGRLDVECDGLEQVARAIIAEYIALDGYRLSTDWIDAVQKRHSWGAPQATLADLGQDLGLTRERVRQVLDRLEALVGQRRWPVPALLAETVERLRDAGFRDSPRVLFDGGLVTDDDWTIDEVAELLDWFGQQEVAGGLRLQALPEEQPTVDPDLEMAVQSSRNKMGLTNVDLVPSPTGLYPREAVIDALRKRYGRVYVSGNWAISGDAKQTMVEGAAARQLAVTSPLSREELIEGLGRVQRNRAAPALPPASIVVDLLCQSGALQAAGDGFTGPGDRPEPGTIASWLVGLLEEADGHVLHRESIVRHAVDDGINTSSLGVNLTYNPVIRSEGSHLGLIRLVGRKPTELQCQHAIDVATALRVPTELDWASTNDGLDVRLTIGSNLLAGGVTHPARALAEAWPTSGAAVSCLCTRTFDGRVRVSDSGALVGWSPLITHVLLRHEAREGSTLVLHLAQQAIDLQAIIEPT